MALIGAMTSHFPELKFNVLNEVLYIYKSLKGYFLMYSFFPLSFVWDSSNYVTGC